MRAAPRIGKAGILTKNGRILSTRTSGVLSILCVAGLLFLALLSFTSSIRDPGSLASGLIGAQSSSALDVDLERRILEARHDVNAVIDSSTSSTTASNTTGEGNSRGGSGAGSTDAVHIPGAVFSESGGSHLPPGGGSSQGQASNPIQSKAPLRLLLASHARLFWYDTGSGEITMLHEGGGVHYGVFPGEVDESNGNLKTVWNAVRPHNWHPNSSEEYLLQLDADSGHEVSRIKLPSRFTHDVVRRGQHVYVCNTEQGQILQLAYPKMTLVHAWPLFTLKQHVNTLAPLEAHELWAVLHNLGKSDLVKLDISHDPPRVLDSIKAVGSKAHGLVQWQGGRFIVLDSEGAALIAVDPDTHMKQLVWKVPGGSKFLKGLAVVDDVAYFGISEPSKRSQRSEARMDSELAAVSLTTHKLLWRRQVPTHGLLNIVAAPQLSEESTYRAQYYAKIDESIGCRLEHGSNSSNCGGAGSKTSNQVPSRSNGQDTKASSSIDRVANGAGRGKHHIVAARSAHSNVTESKPLHGRRQDAGSRHSIRRAGQASNSDSKKSSSGAHSMHDSTSSGAHEAAGSARHSAAEQLTQAHAEQQRQHLLNNKAVQEANQKLAAMGYKPKISGHWSTGLPRLDIKVKASAQSWLAGIQLPLTQLDVSALQAKILNMPQDMWELPVQRKLNAAVDGRKDNMEKFKPGVQSMFLVFSDQSTENVYRFPYYDYFKNEVDDILRKVIGEQDLHKVVRMQFALMKPGTTIKLHRDMGGYALSAHRLHIPIVTHRDVIFDVCPSLEKPNGSHLPEHSEDGSSCNAIPMAEGMVFEVNNRVLHRVFNRSPVRRVQLVVDVSETPRTPKLLKPGTICNYLHQKIVCPH